MDPYASNYWKSGKYPYAPNEGYTNINGAAPVAPIAPIAPNAPGSNGFVEKIRSPVNPYPMANEWQVTSGCHSSCMINSLGIQAVRNKRTGTKNIQLCSHVIKVSKGLERGKGEKERERLFFYSN